MVKIKSFRGVRPAKEYVSNISCRPYDVLSSEEARQEAAIADKEMSGKGKSLYHITLPEINFGDAIADHDERLYETATCQYAAFKENGWLKKDAEECYYVYAQTWHEKTQYGLVVAANVEDYEAGRIKKHELTRQDKEDDRKRHVVACNANMGPAFFAYPKNPTLHAVIEEIVKGATEYDFTKDEVRHQMWIISDKTICNKITDIFATIPNLYIADGHHRSAAAARVGLERKAANPNHTGSEEYNYFLAVCFSGDELTVLDYNRLVLDLNEHTEAEIIALLKQDFAVEEKGTDIYKPAKRHEFGLYMGNTWYKLTAKAERFDENDPIDSLDVSISSNLILNKIFGITNLRTDKRIEFVGGIRGLNYLQQRVDNQEAKLALALYPVSMDEVMKVADAGKIMPPKATWFEPKLRSGIVIHELD